MQGERNQTPPPEEALTGAALRTWSEWVLLAAVAAFGCILTLAYFNGTPPALATFQGTVALLGIGALGWLAVRLGSALVRGEDEAGAGADPEQQQTAPNGLANAAEE